jgi:hypothetical protein
MKLEKLAGATSEIWQIFVQDKTSTTGAGLAGLVFNTAGLTAYYHRDTDTTATVITLVTMTVGTFTSSGFKEIDATNMPGWYQFCPPNAALASGAKSCGFHLKGGGNMADLPIEVQLVAYNPDNATTLGLTNLDATVSSRLATAGYTAPLNLSAAATATAIWQDAVAGDFTAANSIGKSVMNGVALGTGLTVNNLTNLPSIPVNWITAAGINAAALNGKGDWLLASSYTAPLSAAATATAVWQDTTAGDFTVAASIGKSVMNGVALGTGLTVNDLTTKTGFSVSATGLDLVAMSDLGAPPSATAKIASGLSWIFMAVQNDRKTTSTQDTIANSANAVVGTATVSDDGTTYEKTKYA